MERPKLANLIEIALITPFLLLVAFNAINFGYYFYVAIHLASAPHQAVEYSVQGGSTPAQITLPNGGPASNLQSVSSLAYADIQNSLPSYGSATVRVCSKSVGALNNAGTATQTTKCCITNSNSSSCSVGNGSFTAPSSDPESPYFVLHRWIFSTRLRL